MHSSTGNASGNPGGSVTHQALREFAGLHHELTEVRHWLLGKGLILCSFVDKSSAPKAMPATLVRTLSKLDRQGFIPPRRRESTQRCCSLIA